MHVGMCSIFQNPGNAISDQLVYSNEVKLAEFAEPLGFESIWTVEHHFTNYTMCPDPMQFLTYMAAKTKTIKLGSMVVVLPCFASITTSFYLSNSLKEIGKHAGNCRLPIQNNAMVCCQRDQKHQLSRCF